MPSINIIGAGNLGKTIGRLLVIHKIATIEGICNASKESALKAIEFIGDGRYYSTASELPEADLTFITTPDDAITLLCKQFSNNRMIMRDKIVLHCSGSLTSDALSSAKERGFLTASIHPMRSFARPELGIEYYKGTFCAMEGDPEALNIIQLLFNSIGSITYTLDKEHKSAYHAAGVFASNYLVTLSKQALECMKFSGIEEQLAMQVITNIMKGTVFNLENTLSCKQALTGPIHRGDILTIENHMNHLPNHHLKELYSILGLATLELTEHDQNKKLAIKEALQEIIN